MSAYMLGWIAALFLKSTALLLGAALLGHALRRRSAAARHAVWSVALVGLLALPALSVTLPRWEMAVLPAGANTAPAPSTAASIELAPATARLAAPVETLAELVPSSVTQPLPPAASTRARHWSEWAFLVWTLGATVGLLRIAAGAWVAQRIARAAVALHDPEWSTVVADVSRALGLALPVTLLASGDITLPVVWGYRRPHVLLPPDAGSWPPERKRAFLLHELAHVERHDCLVQTLASVATALYWPHPLVWWTMRRLRRDAEHACDDRVLSAGTRGPEYAGHLLDLARTLHDARTPTVVMGIAERSNLEDRLLALLNPQVRRGAVGRRRVAAGAAGGLVLVASVAAFQPVARAAVAEVLALARSAPPIPAIEPSATPPRASAPPTAPPSRRRPQYEITFGHEGPEPAAATVEEVRVAAEVAPSPAPAAPAPPEAANEAPVIVRIGVDMVQIDAIVTDGSGRQVEDLTAGDFEIRQDGKAQPVAHARYVTVASAARAPGGPTSARRRDDVKRIITLVVDDLGLSFQSLHRVREGLKTLVESHLGAGDLAAVVPTSRKVPLAQQLTGDKDVLLAAIDGIQYQPWQRGATSDTSLRDGYFARTFGEATFEALEAMLKDLRGLPGRKSVLFFSDRLSLRDIDAPTMVDPALLNGLNRVTDAASRAAAVVYSIDPRDLFPAMLSASGRPDPRYPVGPQIANARTEMTRQRLDDHDGMARLADATGGLLFLEGWHVDTAVERIMEDQKGYYLVAYTPDSSAFKPNKRGHREYHEIRVRVKRPGVKVRSRAGFYGVTDAEWPPAAKS